MLELGVNSLVAGLCYCTCVGLTVALACWSMLLAYVNPCTIFIEFHYEQPLLLLTMTVISNIKAAMIVAATADLFLRTSFH